MTTQVSANILIDFMPQITVPFQATEIQVILKKMYTEYGLPHHEKLHIFCSLS
jgi:hypothetical protein